MVAIPTLFSRLRTGKKKKKKNSQKYCLLPGTIKKISLILTQDKMLNRYYTKNEQTNLSQKRKAVISRN